MTDDYTDDFVLTESLDDLEVDDDVDTLDYEPGDDEFPDNEVVDIDEQMAKVYGNVPKPGQSFSIAEEVEKDEESRRGMD